MRIVERDANNSPELLPASPGNKCNPKSDFVIPANVLLNKNVNLSLKVFDPNKSVHSTPNTPRKSNSVDKIQSLPDKTGCDVISNPNIPSPENPPCNKISEVVANVLSKSPNIPLIPVTLNNTVVPFLLDTGSSISLIKSDVFNVIKQQIKCRYLSRMVQITTLNSEVHFQACVEFTFKLNNVRFKHLFYVINLHNEQNFTGILGYDFITKVNLKLHPAEKFCSINDLKIPFIQLKDVPNQICNATNCSNNLTEKQTNVSAKTYLVHKTTLEPNEGTFVKLTCNYSFPHESFLFTPCFNNDKIFSESSIIANDISKSSTTFSIFIENLSDNIISLNKGMYFGDITQIDDIKEQPQENSNMVNEFVNLIRASSETLNARIKEFDLNDFQLNHLSPNHRSKLQALLNKHKTAFSKSLKTLGHTDRIVPEINFTSDFPRKTLPFPIPQAIQAEAKTQINELLDAGIIKKNLSSWSCPMLLVRKKTPPGQKQQYRLALDLRILNSIIEPSTYPLPKISDIVSKLSKYKYFTTLDMPSAYHQVDLPEKYRDRLSFITPWSTYMYTRLIFGLKNSSSIFQALMDSLVEECEVDGIFDYQDDLVIGANSFEEMLAKLDKIFTVFANNNLTFSARKSDFFTECIDYLGFRINQYQISPISSNITKIISFPRPKNKKQLKSFLGTCGFYRCLIPAYAQVTDPLVKITSPKVDFVWNDIHEKAFQQVQKFFFQKPFVIQPDFSKEFYLNTDASKTAISAILLQKKDDKLLPISFFSKALKNSESKYPPIKLELFAIFKGLNAFKYYLYGRTFKILSDSKPLAHYKKINMASDITSRWLAEISLYDFEFIHLPGKDNLLADLFSRTVFSKENVQDLTSHPELIDSNEVLPISQETVNPVTVKPCKVNNEKSKVQLLLDKLNKENIKDPILEISVKTMLKAQLEDKHLRKIYCNILDCNNHYSESRKFYLICPDTQLLLHAKDPAMAEKANVKIALPNSLHSKALRIAHVSHFGIHKTYNFLSETYFWPGMFADTANYVSSCDRCNSVKKHRIPVAPFQNVPVPSFPGEFISMDITGPVSDNWYILTIIDHFSRHLCLYPLKKITAENVVSSLFQYCTVFGKPSMVLSDLGSQFTSHIFSLFNEMHGILVKHTSVANPQANSISERVNTSIKSTIQALLLDGVSFHNALKIHQMLYNSSIHRSTKFSPNFVHFGRELGNLYHTYNPNKNSVFLDKHQNFFEIVKDLEIIYKKVYDNLTLAQHLQNKKQSGCKLRKFNIGDQVYIKNTNTFKVKFDGPYVVTKIISPVIVALEKPGHPSTRIPSIHINRLRATPKRKDSLNSHLHSTQSPMPAAQNLPTFDNSYNPLNNANSVPSAAENLTQTYPIVYETFEEDVETHSQHLNETNTSDGLPSDVSSVSLFNLGADTESSSFNLNSSDNSCNDISVSDPPTETSHPYNLRSRNAPCNSINIQHSSSTVNSPGNDKNQLIHNSSAYKDSMTTSGQLNDIFVN